MAETRNRHLIPPLNASADGHAFVVYGDSCSGMAGASNEANLRAINAAIDALENKPDFIRFLGDEIMGLVRERADLLRRWSDDAPWSSRLGASAWGPERLTWSGDWRIGALAEEIRWHHQVFAYGDWL